MNLKRFSDFSTVDEIVEHKDDVVLEKNENDTEIDLDEKTGEAPEKDKDKEPVEDTKETVTDTKESVSEVDDFQIVILEENILKFNNGHIKKIYELLSDKYSTTDYFLRSKDNNLHVVKYNESLDLNINNFVDSLFKFYSTKKELKPLSHNIKIKGNDKFSVVENINPNVIDKVVGDLSKLLSIKK